MLTTLDLILLKNVATGGDNSGPVKAAAWVVFFIMRMERYLMHVLGAVKRQPTL